MDVLKELDYYYATFKGEKGSIGTSVLGKEIKYLCVKKSDSPTIIFQYAIHAREYITTYLALKQIDEFIDGGINGTVYFIPIANPDGVEISLNSAPLWKANAKGVDLNVNFDARWGSGVDNTRISGSENYIGEYPFSESETVALRDFTYKIKPDMTVSYHAKGEEIYYEFSQPILERKRDYKLAEAVSKLTGYQIKSTPFSAGGYKDWCIDKLKIPALTIEVGSDELTHPIQKRSLPSIYAKNRGVVKLLTEIL